MKLKLLKNVSTGTQIRSGTGRKCYKCISEVRYGAIDKNEYCDKHYSKFRQKWLDSHKEMELF